MKQLRLALQTYLLNLKQLSFRHTNLAIRKRLVPCRTFVFTRALSQSSLEFTTKEEVSKTEREERALPSVSNKRSHERLRILFFGSDEFSVKSLEVLHRFREELNIDCIDVVCRPPKRTGRGLRKISEVPIHNFAEGLSLSVHEVDSFEGWQAPVPEKGPINLLIAVSFGLLIPANLINDAKYGGINVHPSKLPDLRGPAPLHHTLLQSRQTTAVTVQTLHPSKFDCGAIIQQDEFRIPVRCQRSLKSLQDWMAGLAAKALRDCLWSAMFLPPIQDVGSLPTDTSAFPQGISRAPKITKEYTHIDWQTWTASQIIHRNRILGPLWNIATITPSPKGLRAGKQVKKVRVIFDDFRRQANNWKPEEIKKNRKDNAGSPLPPGTIEVLIRRGESHVGVWTCDEEWVGFGQVTTGGRAPANEPAAEMHRWGIGHYSSWAELVQLA